MSKTIKTAIMPARKRSSRSIPLVSADLPNHRDTPSLTHDIDSTENLAALRFENADLQFGGGAGKTTSSTLSSDLSNSHTNGFDTSSEPRLIASPNAADTPFNDDDDNEVFAAEQEKVDEMASVLRRRRLEADALVARRQSEQADHAAAVEAKMRGQRQGARPLGETNNDILAETMTVSVPVAIGLIISAPFLMMLLVLWWHKYHA